MRVSTPVLDKTYEAQSDLSASGQFTFVKFVATSGGTTAPQCRIDQATATTRGIVILQNAPKQYKGAVVRMHGTSKLKVDGNASAIAAGDVLKPNGSGLGIKTTTAGDYFGAVALEPSTVSGDIIEVWCLTGTV